MNHQSPGLTDLAEVDLDPQYHAMLAAVTRDMGGHRAWRERKATEARQLLGLGNAHGR